MKYAESHELDSLEGVVQLAKQDRSLSAAALDTLTRLASAAENAVKDLRRVQDDSGALSCVQRIEIVHKVMVGSAFYNRASIGKQNTYTPKSTPPTGWQVVSNGAMKLMYRYDLPV